MQRISNKKEHAEVDLKPLNDQYNHLAQVLVESHNRHSSILDQTKTALDMQSRALVGLKMQRDVDRKRRLQVIKRMKKHQAEYKKSKFQVKCAMGAMLLFSILTLILK